MASARVPSVPGLRLEFPGWEFTTSPAQQDPPTERSWLSDLDELEGEECGTIGRRNDEAEGIEESSTDVTSNRADGTCFIRARPGFSKTHAGGRVRSPAHPAVASTDTSAHRQDRSSILWEGTWPSDVLHAVLMQLDAAQDLCRARAVNRDWLDAASVAPLWERAWARDPRFAGTSRRVSCGVDSFRTPPPRYSAFWDFAVRSRAHQCYRWLDLQKGWDRLEQLLQPAPIVAARETRSGALLDSTLSVGYASHQPTAKQPAMRGHSQHTPTSPSKRDRHRKQLSKSSGFDKNEIQDLSTLVEQELPSGQIRTSGLSKARRLAAILTNRDWELTYNCVRLLQLECAQNLGACLAPNAYGRVEHISCQDTSDSTELEAGSQRRCDHWLTVRAARDEFIILHLLASFDAYSRWLAVVSSTFGHQSGSGCGSHLACLVAAQRGNEMVERQHTPTLSAGGLAAFRSAVVLHPHIEASLRRHIFRAESSLLRHGGWTIESGRLMQSLIDLDSCLSKLDVRDDHLSEEIGLLPSQERLRYSLLAPLRACWQKHGTQWFCGTRIASEDLTLYVGGGSRSTKRRRGHGLILEPPSST